MRKVPVRLHDARNRHFDLNIIINLDKAGVTNQKATRNKEASLEMLLRTPSGIESYYISMNIGREGSGEKMDLSLQLIILYRKKLRIRPDHDKTHEAGRHHTQEKACKMYAGH